MGSDEIDSVMSQSAMRAIRYNLYPIELIVMREKYKASRNPLCVQ